MLATTFLRGHLSFNGFIEWVGSSRIQALQIWKITKIWTWHKFILLKLIPRSSRLEVDSLSLHWSSSVGGLTIIACINTEPHEQAPVTWGPEMFNSSSCHCLLWIELHCPPGGYACYYWSLILMDDFHSYWRQDMLTHTRTHLHTYTNTGSESCSMPLNPTRCDVQTTLWKS